MNTLKEASILSLCEEVAEENQIIPIASGSVLLEPGEISNKVYIIKSGVFKIGIKQGNRAFTIDYLFPGYVTGLINLYQSVKYPCYILSLTDSSVFVWERTKILELMSFMPEISKGMKRTYSGWGLQVVDRLKTLAFLAPYQRVAKWVYDYNKFEQYRQNKLWQYLSLKEMSEYCHVNQSEFENVIGELVRDDIIELKDRDCFVSNWDKLSYIINTPA